MTELLWIIIMIKPYDIDVINMQIIGDYDDLLRHLHLMGFKKNSLNFYVCNWWALLLSLLIGPLKIKRLCINLCTDIDYSVGCVHTLSPSLSHTHTVARTLVRTHTTLHCDTHTLTHAHWHTQTTHAHTHCKTADGSWIYAMWNDGVVKKKIEFFIHVCVCVFLSQTLDRKTT